jgi:D-amino-acid oxidase
LYRKWSKISHDFFHQLWKDGKAEDAGISMIPCYRLTTDPEGHKLPCWSEIVYGFRLLSDSEITKLSNEHQRKYTGGSHFISYCCEPIKFLPYLMKRFNEAGGKFEMRKINDINEIEDYDLIVNCTGLGSREMTNDKEIRPIRGQVARVNAPWLYEVVLHEDDDGNYIIPNTDTIVLGGTHQVDDYNLNVSTADSAFIMNGCTRISPSLKHGIIVKEFVGLRPGRTSVRLEIEKRIGKCAIIHNVGHGGCGVTLCWGCGDEVLENTIQIFNEKSSKL